MALREAIGAGVQNELFRGAGQYIVLIGLGTYLFGTSIFTEQKEWNFTSQEGIDSRVIVNLLGLATTLVLSRAILRDQ